MARGYGDGTYGEGTYSALAESGLLTYGWETGDGPAPTIVGTVTTTTERARSGTSSAKITSATSYSQWAQDYALGTDFYLRQPFWIDGAPSGLLRLCEILTPTVVILSLRLDTLRRLQLYDLNGNPIGSATSPVALNQWNDVEIKFRINASGNGVTGMRLNGADVLIDQPSNLGNNPGTRLRIGNDTAVTIPALFHDSLSSSITGWQMALAAGTPVTAINANGGRKLTVPIGAYNVNNSVMRSNDDRYVIRFVPDKDITMRHFISGFNVEGVNVNENGQAAPYEIRNLTSGAHADALHTRVMGDLAEFGDWCDFHNVQGMVGEFGIPTNPNSPPWLTRNNHVPADDAKWVGLLDAYYDDLDDRGLHSIQWACFPDNVYELAPYMATGSIGSPFDTSNPSSGPLEGHQDAPQLRAVTMAGLDQSEGILPSNGQQYGNHNPGTLSQDYFDLSQDHWNYVAAQGVTQAKIPFKWERIQRTLGGPLDNDYLTLVKTQVGYARIAGFTEIILGCYNAGGYKTALGELRLGSPQLTSAHFSDLWVRLSKEFAEDSNVVAYGLMNEPHDLPGGNPSWEAISQACGTAIRTQGGALGTGDNTTVIVSGNNWSTVQGWTNNHPVPWMFLNNVMYEAHQYFDTESSGFAGGPSHDSLYAQVDSSKPIYTYDMAVTDSQGGGRLGYADGNGGEIKAELRICNPDGTPNMTPAGLLGGEQVNAVQRYRESKFAHSFPETGVGQTFYFDMGGVPLQADTPYCVVYSNEHINPADNFYSHQSVCSPVSAAAVHNKNSTKAEDGIMGLDPREVVMWSIDNGTTWYYGRHVGGDTTAHSINPPRSPALPPMDGTTSTGYYNGFSGLPSVTPDDAVRLPWYGYRESVSAAAKAAQPYYTYTDSGSYTVRCVNAARTVTASRAGGFAKQGQNVGVVTVRNVTTGQEGSTASLGSGLVSGLLDVEVTINAGESFTISNTGVVILLQGDGFIRSTFNVGDPTSEYPISTDGTSGKDFAQLYVDPWPYYAPQITLPNTTGGAFIPDSPDTDLGDNFSISFWYRRDRLNTREILLAQEGGGPFIGFQPFFSDVLLYFNKDINFAGWYAAPPSDNSWHHVVVTKTSGLGTDRGKIYIDGVDKTIGTSATTSFVDGGDTYIGTDPEGIFPLRGGMDELVFYKRVLSDADIQLLYSTEAAMGRPTLGMGALAIDPPSILPPSPQMGDPTVDTSITGAGGIGLPPGVLVPQPSLTRSISPIGIPGVPPAFGALVVAGGIVILTITPPTISNPSAGMGSGFIVIGGDVEQISNDILRRLRLFIEETPYTLIVDEDLATLTVDERLATVDIDPYPA